jgi:transcriptional regulator with XRE-family HTH domain
MNDAALEIIARNVRAARTAAGLSLDAAAARAQVSKGALIALEGARGNPNLATLVALADALGLSMSALVEDARADDPLVVVDAADVAPLWTGPDGGTAQLLLTNPSPAPVEVWRWVLHPGERHGEPPHVAGITETVTVVRGRLRLDVGERTRTLRAGQTAVFAADVAHAYEGAGRGPCELLMTVHLPADHRG